MKTFYVAPLRQRLIRGAPVSMVEVIRSLYENVGYTFRPACAQNLDECKSGKIVVPTKLMWNRQHHMPKLNLHFITCGQWLCTATSHAMALERARSGWEIVSRIVSQTLTQCFPTLLKRCCGWPIFVKLFLQKIWETTDYHYWHMHITLFKTQISETVATLRWNTRSIAGH